MAFLASTCCRLCLNSPPSDSLVFSIFDTFQGKVLSQLIEELFAIKVLEEDRLRSLCLECVNRINTVHKIKQLFVENDRKLHELQPNDPPSSDPSFVEELVYDVFSVGNADSTGTPGEGSSVVHEIATQESSKAAAPSPSQASIDEVTNDGTPADLYLDAKDEPAHSSPTSLAAVAQPTQLPQNKCYFCGVIFESQIQFIHHLPSHFDDVPYTCLECDGLVFKTVREASKHISYHDANERPFKCRICTLRFPTRVNSLTHERKIHRFKLKRMEATKGKGPASKQRTSGRRSTAQKKQHITKSSSSSPKHPIAQHVCEICDKRFTAKKNLTRHLMIHTGEKPFKCDRCDRSFRQAGEIKKHLCLHPTKRESTEQRPTIKSSPGDTDSKCTNKRSSVKCMVSC
ncbi:zinc finger protein 70-like [Anopheles stephensi]|nr:zinc finger protein 70-like [Anopheles stephensi]